MNVIAQAPCKVSSFKFPVVSPGFTLNSNCDLVHWNLLVLLRILETGNFNSGLVLIKKSGAAFCLINRPIRTIGLRRTLPLVLLLFTASAVRAQNRDDTSADSQIWPDIPISIRIDPKLSVIIHATVRIGRNNSAFVNEQIGIGLRRAIGNYFSTSLNYRYLNSEPAPSKLVREKRIFTDLTSRFPLGHGYQLQDRNRIEWREVNGRINYRYRNRIQIERSFSIGEKTLTPYLSGEYFYDTRFRAWNRTQYFAGMRVPLSKHLTLDGFYMRQLDDRVNPGFLHVIGSFLRIDM